MFQNNINLSGVGQGQQQINLQNANTVPSPIKKDPGPGNQNLLLDSSSSSNPKTNVISFGNLGSFTYDSVQLIPSPPTELPPPPKQMSSKDTSYVFKLSKEECKQALLKWAGLKSFRSKKPVEEGHIGECYSYNALEYKLETFNEKRGLVSKYASCRPGETIDKLGSGTYPNLWSIGSAPSNNFVNETRRINYPHTDVLQPCFACNAYGELKCSICNGTGKCKCSTCLGQKTVHAAVNGRFENVPCSKCNGTGAVNCIKCSLSGKYTCNICNGTQVLKWFLQVEVQYINHVDEYVKEKTDLPDELLKTVKGEILHQDEGVQILPIQDSDNKDIVENSTRLITKAAQSYSQEKRILQRHVLNCVTCVECDMHFNGQDFKFWVYGNERQVYCPNYPGSSCCCVII